MESPTITAKQAISEALKCFGNSNKPERDFPWSEEWVACVMGFFFVPAKLTYCWMN